VQGICKCNNIAAGLSPFDPESVAVEAGRIMLNRIYQIIDERESFAFETTLATRSYVSLIKKIHAYGYKVTLLYFWLKSPEFAIQRVAKRVSNGGHNIPADVIERRYYRGIANLINLYIPVVDSWRLIDNLDAIPNIIAKGVGNEEEVIILPELWNRFIEQSKSSYGK
jgi:predicted ABC-type ATPase